MQADKIGTEVFERCIVRKFNVAPGQKREPDAIPFEERETDKDGNVTVTELGLGGQVIAQYKYWEPLK